MAFNRKNWQDNVSDVTAAELNRIEQGIYDNSLVVEAITNTLNPTDTETYKTAELTEGQITDVIGVKDILIKGQTSQNGEPTPSSPVDVNVVSGSNVINIYNNQTLGKELPLDLPVVNLFDKDNETYTNGYINGSSATKLSNSTYNRTLYIPCKPNTTYAIQKMVPKDTSKFIIASSVDVPEVEVNIYNVVDAGTNSPYAIYTTSNNAKYLLVNYMQTNSTSTTVAEMLNSIQIEQGSKVNAYTSFGTEPIELCKIGNYQDYFYKSGSKWCLHKEIGKKVLDGSESGWNVGATNTSGYNRFVNKTILSLVLIPLNNSEIVKLLSNMLITTNANSNFARNNGIAVDTGGNFCVYYTDIASYTKEQFLAWLASNNITLYYALATSTNTEITDTTLISQLEAIYNAPLYEQTNITQENNDLPMILDITACKDNINGIKAFIRK